MNLTCFYLVSYTHRLRSCHITEEGCADLSLNILDLEELDLSDNNIGDSGVKQLSCNLKHGRCKLQKLL